MSTLAVQTDERVKDVHFTDETIGVDLMDGRTITVPLVWYPRLLNATPDQRQQWERCGAGYGIHWEAIDEDLSTEGMLRGAPAPKKH
jgi:Protein of unknown function (DUF2442)